MIFGAIPKSIMTVDELVLEREMEASCRSFYGAYLFDNTVPQDANNMVLNAIYDENDGSEIVLKVCCN